MRAPPQSSPSTPGSSRCGGGNPAVAYSSSSSKHVSILCSNERKPKPGRAQGAREFGACPQDKKRAVACRREVVQNAQNMLPLPGKMPKHASIQWKPVSTMPAKSPQSTVADSNRWQSIQPFNLSTSQPFNPHLVTCHLAFGLTLPRRLRTILPVARHALPLRPQNTATLGNKRNSQCFSAIQIACPLVPTKNPKPKGKP